MKYILSDEPTEIKDYFAVLAEEERPTIVDDRINPGIWDHPRDDVIVVTSAPRDDAGHEEISIEGRQVDDVVKELHGEDIVSDDPLIAIPEKHENPKPVRGPHTFRERGFKVGRIS